MLKTRTWALAALPSLHAGRMPGPLPMCCAPSKVKAPFNPLFRRRMSRQYNMYNVQLSEFWKQRVGKESMHNAPYMFALGEGEEGDYSDLVSEAPSRRSQSQMSVASTATRNRVSSAPSFLLPHPAACCTTSCCTAGFLRRYGPSPCSSRADCGTGAETGGGEKVGARTSLHSTTVPLCLAGHRPAPPLTHCVVCLPAENVLKLRRCSRRCSRGWPCPGARRVTARRRTRSDVFCSSRWPTPRLLSPA